MLAFILNVPLEILEYSNYNLKDIVTPVNVAVYAKLLKEARYEPQKIKYLVNGFARGFPLEY